MPRRGIARRRSRPGAAAEGRLPRRALRQPATGKRPAVASVSAERGYARETGNLVFHAALVGVLSRSASAADSPTPGRPSSSRATASSTRRSATPRSTRAASSTRRAAAVRR
jgi:hypothetical protein